MPRICIVPRVAGPGGVTSFRLKFEDGLRARWVGPRYTLRAIYGNANLSFIRRRLADHVIYQSQFIKHWWEDWYRPARVPASVILNGADLSQYTPHGLH